MIPLPPLSVKFPDDERAQLKNLAATIGWPESRIVRDSVAHMLHVLERPGSVEEPKFVSLARLALQHEKKTPPCKPPRKPASSEKT
jgi:hypothetical protein